MIKKIRYISIFLFSLVLILRSINIEINRDENQFFSGIILWRDFHLMPYRDYPFAHTPYIIFIYSLLNFSDYSFLDYRIISSFLGILIPLIISLKFDSLAGTMIFFILSTNSIFMNTYPYIWNHQLSCLLLLIAFIIYESNLKRKVFLTGFLIGISTGVRLSMFVFIFPYIIFLINQRKRLIELILGFFIAILPIVMFFIYSPDGFIYGNFLYNIYLNPKFYGFAEKSIVEIILYKLWAFFRLLLKYNFEILILSVLSLLITFKTSDFKSQFIVLFFALVSSLLPTPIFNQYIFVFIIVLSYFTFKNLYQKSSNPKLIFLLIIIAILNILKQKKFFEDIKMFQDSFAYKIHKISYEIKKLTKNDTIFTLTPIIPLEAKIPIYPITAHSPFSLRIADLIDKEKRKKYNVFSFDELDEIKPKFILLSKENYNAYLKNYISKCLILKTFDYEIKLYKCF